MIDIHAEIEKVKQFILSNKKPAYFTTNRKELRVRCPYCGDSKSNPTHAHLYIEMKPPFKFYCQKCNTGGVLNSKTMRDFQLYDSEISISLNDLAKEVNKNKGYSTISFKKRDFKFPIVENEISNLSVNYFNNRYNTNFSNEEIVNKFKAVTDPITFFQDNYLFIRPNQYDLSRAIGFVSSDSSHIVFRDTSNSQPRRYYNYSVDPDFAFESSKIYTIKNNIDVLSPEIELIITEGIFDIIGVYNAFYKGNEENKIFAAACGKGFNTVILNYFRKGFLNMKISIYSDADLGIEFFKNLKNTSPYLKRANLNIFYNEIGKDYGVPPDQIKLKKIILR